MQASNGVLFSTRFAAVPFRTKRSLEAVNSDPDEEQQIPFREWYRVIPCIVFTEYNFVILIPWTRTAQSVPRTVCLTPYPVNAYGSRAQARRHRWRSCDDSANDGGVLTVGDC